MKKYVIEEKGVMILLFIFAVIVPLSFCRKRCDDPVVHFCCDRTAQLYHHGNME
jgi:hypothetical protein